MTTEPQGDAVKNQLTDEKRTSSKYHSSHIYYSQNRQPFFVFNTGVRVSWLGLNNYVRKQLERTAYCQNRDTANLPVYKGEVHATIKSAFGYGLQSVGLVSKMYRGTYAYTNTNYLSNSM